jgi:hypothetical protein
MDSMATAARQTAAPRVGSGSLRLSSSKLPLAVMQLHNQRRAFWKLQEKLQNADDRAKRAYAEVCRVAVTNQLTGNHVCWTDAVPDWAHMAADRRSFV